MKYKDEILDRRYKQVEFLRKIKLPKQRSQEWYDMREKMITASAVAESIGHSHYKASLEFVVEKCGFPSYVDGPHTHHGKKFENIVTLIYSERNDVEVHEFGVLPHPKYDFLGASPDGICGAKTLSGEKSKLIGRMVEIKCPATRVIQTEGEIDGGICPHYYFMQVQQQLDVCGLDECDFVQCKIHEYENREEYQADTTATDKGCLLQFFPKSTLNNKCACGKCDQNNKLCKKTKYGVTTDCMYKAKYIYPPKSKMSQKEMNEFIVDTLSRFSCGEFPDVQYEYAKDGTTIIEEYVFDRVLYWHISLFHVTLIPRDKDWIKNNISNLRKVWKYVLYYRENKKKLLELKRLYDRFQAKFAKKEKLIKYSFNIMEDYMIKGGKLDEIVDFYFDGPPLEKAKTVKKASSSKFVDSDMEYDISAFTKDKPKAKKVSEKKTPAFTIKKESFAEEISAPQCLFID